MKKKSRMFEGLRTWNPWFGCEHHCYRNGCWANKKLAHRLGKMLNCDLCYGFKPHFHKDRLRKVPSDSEIFVVGHGDLFGKWVPKQIIEEILSVCWHIRKKTWFFETKNPSRYAEVYGLLPPNTVLSTTIETNRVYEPTIMGYAPQPEERFKSMYEIAKRYEKPIHVSIEPIMDFDLNILLRWIKKLRPYKVAVGYDSLHNNLPEPTKDKTMALINELEKFTKVERKQL